MGYLGLREKDDWTNYILSDRIQISNSKKESTLLLRDPFDLDKNELFLPKKIKLITCSNDAWVFFITDDEPYKVKYYRYWKDENRNTVKAALQTVEENFNHEGFQFVHSQRRIIDIYSTKDALYALTTESDDKGTLGLTRWVKMVDEISNPSFTQIYNCDYNGYENLRLLVTDLDSDRSIALVYGFHDKPAYYGRLMVGNRRCDMEPVEKLVAAVRSQYKLFMDVYTKKITKDSTSIEYWGIDADSNSFFVLRLALSKKAESKFYARKLQSFRASTPSSLSHVSAFTLASFSTVTEEIEERRKFRVLGFLTTTKTGKIFTIYTNDDEKKDGLDANTEFFIIPYLDTEQRNSDEGTKSKETDVNNKTIDSLLLISNQLLLYGGLEDEYWGAHCPAYYERTTQTPRKKTTNKASVSDS